MAETRHGIYFVEQIAEGIYKMYEQRNACVYLVVGEKRACLIDTAFGLTNLKELVSEFTDLPVTVVNTHGHIDHVLGDHWFEEAYLHPSDRFMYDEITSGFSGMVREPWVQDFYGDFIKNIDVDSICFPVPKEISEGDVIDLGGRILEVYEMPGHTAGSIVLIDRADKICFSGDAIIEQLWLFLEESLSPEVYLDSLKKMHGILSENGIDKIYSGHFNSDPISLEKTALMIEAMELVIGKKIDGVPVETHAGKGIEYSHKGWKVICKE